MQILQRLFKGATEPQRETSSSPTSTKERAIDQKAKSKEIVLHWRPKRVKKIRLGCRNFNLFSVLSRRDLAKSCFNSTFNLKRLGSSHRRQQCVHSMKIMKKEDIARGLGLGHKAETAAHGGGNKVLPISDATALSSVTNGNDHSNAMVEKKEKATGDKMKTISKMKELLKWAAAAKAEKGGKYIGRKVRPSPFLPLPGGLIIRVNTDMMQNKRIWK
ncbi:unnamed protein product [Ilex paraguariensis]|uniref:Uncharacterized protein n=1 Tax=Ilex paraguariensis TaxID=185542 RepID=A0ABC8T2U4_9AQUA